MLKSNVGYSTNADAFASGAETMTKAMEGTKNPKIALTFTSVKQSASEVIKGIKSVNDIPVVGCTSSGAIIVPDGVISSENGFSGAMLLDDEDLKVGVAASERGENPRETGKKIAIEAVKNSGLNVTPSAFYMVASPAEEEEYLKGIQDIIGRVPIFGGSAADDAVTGDWKIFCNDKVFADGCAVVFFYTNKKIVNEYTGADEETDKRGIITKVVKNRTLAEIDGVPALEKYAEWIGKDPKDLQGLNLLSESILHPLGVKDPIGSVTLIRHPMVGNEDNSMNIGNNLVVGTCVNMMETTNDKLISSVSETIKKVQTKANGDLGAYFLVHCGGRKLAVADRIEEIHKQMKDATNGVPFIGLFTFGEYGVNDHSSNSCGGLMLSFTGFRK